MRSRAEEGVDSTMILSISYDPRFVQDRIWESERLLNDASSRNLEFGLEVEMSTYQLMLESAISDYQLGNTTLALLWTDRMEDLKAQVVKLLFDRAYEVAAYMHAPELLQQARGTWDASDYRATCELLEEAITRTLSTSELDLVFLTCLHFFSAMNRSVVRLTHRSALFQEDGVRGGRSSLPSPAWDVLKICR